METTTTTPTMDDWAGIRYVAYVTAGWLAATVIAVALLMTVVPKLI